MTLPGETLPQLLFARAQRMPARTALRNKDLGIWQPITWQQYAENVRGFALGLLGLGLARGDKVAIVGDNRPQWLYAELATQAVGGVVVGLYQDGLAREMGFVIAHSDARFVVAEDQEQVDKVLEVRAQLGGVQRLIYWDARGMRAYRDPWLMAFTEVQQLGEALAATSPRAFEHALSQGRASDLALLCYTSGTTGAPKGAMLTHGNLIAQARNLRRLDPIRERDELVSFLPPAWIGEQMMSVSSGLLAGAIVNFPEAPETAQADIREIGPHVIFSPPRIWEDLLAQVQIRAEETATQRGWRGIAMLPKRLAYRFLLPAGERAAEARLMGRRLPWPWRLARAAAAPLLLAPIKDHLGLSRARYAYTGGAALGPDVFRFYHALGVNLKQIYGQTEISGISVVHQDHDIRFDTVGQPIPETELRIAEEGEILSRSPSVFLGYFKDEAASARTLRDGWLHSGDSGLIDERGHLVVIDRMSDVMALAGGIKFSPQYLENKLKFSPYIREAVVVGKERPFLVALVNIDGETVAKWAEDRRIAFTTYLDLSQKPEVTRLIAEHVARVNRELPAAARIRRFVVLYKELDADDEELTRTRKVRRAFVEAKYEALVQALYGAAERVALEVDVRYRDGRQSRMLTEIGIAVVEG